LVNLIDVEVVSRLEKEKGSPVLSEGDEIGNLQSVWGWRMVFLEQNLPLLFLTHSPYLWHTEDVFDVNSVLPTASYTEYRHYFKKQKNVAFIGAW